MIKGNGRDVNNNWADKSPEVVFDFDFDESELTAEIEELMGSSQHLNELETLKKEEKKSLLKYRQQEFESKASDELLRAEELRINQLKIDRELRESRLSEERSVFNQRRKEVEEGRRRLAMEKSLLDNIGNIEDYDLSTDIKEIEKIKADKTAIRERQVEVSSLFEAEEERLQVEEELERQRIEMEELQLEQERIEEEMLMREQIMLEKKRKREEKELERQRKFNEEKENITKRRKLLEQKIENERLEAKKRVLEKKQLEAEAAREQEILNQNLQREAEKQKALEAEIELVKEKTSHIDADNVGDSAKNIGREPGDHQTARENNSKKRSTSYRHFNELNDEPPAYSEEQKEIKDVVSNTEKQGTKDDVSRLRVVSPSAERFFKDRESMIEQGGLPESDYIEDIYENKQKDTRKSNFLGKLFRRK